MKSMRKALKEAMSDPKMIARAARDVAEGMVRSAAYREAQKMVEEAEEGAEGNAKRATEGEAPMRTCSPAPRPALSMSPAMMAASRARR